MEYRANFFLHFIGQTLNGVLAPLLAILIYNNSAGIPGWSFWEFMLFIGTAHLIWSIAYVFIFAIVYQVMNYVKEGSFDKILIRPYNPLGFLTTDAIDLEDFGGLPVGIFLIVLSLIKLNLGLSIINLLSYLMVIALALIFIYSVSVLIASVAFTAVKNFGIWAIFETMGAYAQYPLTIFGSKMTFVFTFLVPIGLAAFYPASALLGRIDLLMILKLALSSFSIFAISLLTWNLTMKKYSSAGG